MALDYKDYGFNTEGALHMHHLFIPVVMNMAGPLQQGMRVLDVGCGNGYACGVFLKHGCQVVGIDLSESGIAIARKAHPEGRFEVLPASEDILTNLRESPFDIVFSSEVVEHLYAPRPFTRGCFAALKPGGRFILTTPYHGYLKNLAISLIGGWDKHADPLWDGGHVKLWSRRTITQLLLENKFENVRIRGVGRFPGLWMTMVVACDKPNG